LRVFKVTLFGVTHDVWIVEPTDIAVG